MTQHRPVDGVIDLGLGHPPADALPVEEWRAATAAALDRYGPVALTYGYAAGPGPLIDWLTGRLGRIDGRAPESGEVFVTAGTSAGLELVCAATLTRDDVVVVDSPTYHLALRIIGDHGVRIVAAPTDADGIDPAGTADLLARIARAGGRAPLLYLVPTFANPTGRSLPVDRRAALVEVAASAGTLLVEDDTYRELAYDAPAPPSLWSLGAGVVRLGSFAKTVAPGLRLGYLTGPASFVGGLVERGMLDSGGGVNHTTALAMAAFAASGAYDRHLEGLVGRYRARRDALVGPLGELDVAFRTPAGGWFVWVDLPVPVDRVHAAAARRGVAFLPGTVFHPGTGGERQLRLSFSYCPPADLATGVRRLAAALADAGHSPNG